MAISVRVCEPKEIALLREAFREEMRCQIIHDSIHSRSGWTTEYAVEMNGSVAGYGSVAIAGPWSQAYALYEFYVRRECRQRLFDLFLALVAGCNAVAVETQTNDPILTIMLHTFAQNIRTEKILFEDGSETALAPEGAGFRPAEARDVALLKASGLDDTAGWVVTRQGSIAGAGGILYHYNRPYGDIYMKVADGFRGEGLGAYLVQELKRACRAEGSVPAARCDVQNVASRRTLQKAGFVPCGNLISGDLMRDATRG